MAMTDLQKNALTIGGVALVGYLGVKHLLGNAPIPTQEESKDFAGNFPSPIAATVRFFDPDQQVVPDSVNPGSKDNVINRGVVAIGKWFGGNPDADTVYDFF